MPVHSIKKEGRKELKKMDKGGNVFHANETITSRDYFASQTCGLQPLSRF